MKKSISLVLLGLCSLAFAQTDFPTNRGNLHLDACVADGTKVRCDFTLTPDSDISDYFGPHMVSFISASGERVYAERIRVLEDDWTNDYSRNINLVKGIPIKMSFLLNTKPNAPLRFLNVLDTRVPNVPVRGAAAPATVSTKANATTVTTSGYVITLSNCVKSGNDLKCTAVMSPK